MKKDCEVVRDLMPLVLDDVASDGSKHMVSAHVQTCAECAAYMNQLKADLPAGKKSELDSRAAFDAAAQTLRKQKRRRTLRNILLGALIVCILGLANLYCFDWLMNETRPIPTSEYGIQLSKLADGRLVASFDYHESMTPLYVKRQQVTETAADGSRAEILYLYAEKHIVPHTASTPMQNAGFTLDSGWQTTTAEIRQGTPEEYQVLWRQEDEDAAIPAASPEMEAYYAWEAVLTQLWTQHSESADGKAGFPGVNGERYTLAIHHADALAACVPEWQPRVTPQYLLLDDETIQWILAGVTEEVESNDPFEVGLPIPRVLVAFGGHWFGLDFGWRGQEYRFQTDSMYHPANTVLPDGREARFGVYKKEGSAYALIGEYATPQEALAQCRIQGMPLGDILEDESTELLGQD